MRFVPANLFLYFFLIALGASGFFVATLWPEPKGFYTFILLAGVGGFGVAYYIFHTRRNHAQLVCPVGSDCNAVVNSRYSRFLGVHLEYWGMLYYFIILISYGTLLSAPDLFTKPLLTILVLFSTFGFFFSFYLLFVQAFLLRKWCIWCLLSATLSIAIFFTALVSIEGAMVLLSQALRAIGILHDIGFVFGMGGAMALLFLFSKCLRDRKIDDGELSALKGLSELIWLGLALVLAGQIATYISNAEILSASGPFLTQTLAVFVTAITSAVLMIIFEPFLSFIPFTVTEKEKSGSIFEALRKPLFITLAVMLSSWYTAFAMNYVEQGELINLLEIYGIALVASIGIALLFEQRLHRK